MDWRRYRLLPLFFAPLLCIAFFAILQPEWARSDITEESTQTHIEIIQTVVVEQTRVIVITGTPAPTLLPGDPPPTQTPIPTPTDTLFVAVVKTGIPEGHLHMRTGPGIIYSVILILDEGTELLGVYQEGGWTFARYNDPGGKEVYGWVKSEYIEY